MTTREEYTQLRRLRGYWSAQAGSQNYHGDIDQFRPLATLLAEGWELNHRRVYQTIYEYALGRTYQHNGQQAGCHDYVKLVRRNVVELAPKPITAINVLPSPTIPCGSSSTDFFQVRSVRGLWPAHPRHPKYRGPIEGLRPVEELAAEGWFERPIMRKRNAALEYTVAAKPRSNGVYAQAMWRPLPGKGTAPKPKPAPVPAPAPSPAPEPAHEKQLELPLASAIVHFEISVLFDPGAVKQLLEGASDVITGLLEVRRPKVS